MIPFNRSCFTGDEMPYIAEAFAAAAVAGDGPFTKKAEGLLKLNFPGCERVLLTTSCTHALEMSAILLDLQPGDEVIVPSYTFVSTALAFAMHGARVVFADVRPDTLNLDEEQLSELITPRTRAIVPVHYAGVGCEMDPIMALANQHGLVVIEDNAHGLFGRYKGRALGTIGHLATQSFHGTKNITCGEGGALVVNDPQFVERAEMIREKGTNRALFFRGQIDKYTWVDKGSSYIPSDILAAFLCGQLEHGDEIQSKRRTIWESYWSGIRSWAKSQGVQLPTIPAHCDQAYHMFYLLMPSLDLRTQFIAHLKANGVGAVFHYGPLHRSKMAQQPQRNCPITVDVSDRLVRLPLFNDLTPDQVQTVIDVVCAQDLSGANSAC